MEFLLEVKLSDIIVISDSKSKNFVAKAVECAHKKSEHLFRKLVQLEQSQSTDIRNLQSLMTELKENFSTGNFLVVCSSTCQQLLLILTNHFDMQGSKVVWIFVGELTLLKSMPINTISVIENKMKYDALTIQDLIKQQYYPLSCDNNTTTDRGYFQVRIYSESGRRWVEYISTSSTSSLNR